MAIHFQVHCSRNRGCSHCSLLTQPKSVQTARASSVPAHVRRHNAALRTTRGCVSFPFEHVRRLRHGCMCKFTPECMCSNLFQYVWLPPPLFPPLPSPLFLSFFFFPFNFGLCAICVLNSLSALHL